MGAVSECSVSMCRAEAVRRSRTLCEKHYRRFLAHGDPEKTLRPGLELTPEQKLRNKIVVFGECWLFGTGPGYGRISLGGGRTEAAHRLAWELSNGPIPAGLVVRHKCDVPRCIRPEHLELGTFAENSRDMTDRIRQARGERQGSSKITADDVRAMRADARSGTPYRVLARRYRVCESEVSAIVIGRKWRHVDGALRPRVKHLRPDERAEIVALVEAGLTHKEAASKYGVARSTVSNLMNRNRKR